MPIWYRYCHKEWHIKFECPQSNIFVICYSCHQYGHRSFECTRRNTPISSLKKRDRKSYQTQPLVSINTTKKNIETSISDYKDEERDDMSITSDTIEDQPIEAEGLLQPTQDLQAPAQHLSSGDDNSTTSGCPDVPSYHPKGEIINNNLSSLQ
ncbi:hypothetical protein G6F46_010710 [Rhizopus delemar]|uniref:CCHC-type domain-containing protein n=2 Tax=Rhizopus TaxID=4842 RepID=A0A9P7CR58_9FUNG|nr:hypothetical protein G6F55_010005 [Rhizopus delemar]KAG1536820.1 hypothetical protein G6F51_010743 [Rhizopus arrhizus]KAG1504110.1 hypothetical protein G6F53_010470 [Rhizopus delemar]KAG1505318.1 hypothetical protein G6F54_000383 [Rhizopus delemar]KAG1520215.1 hypothetical protein G6F52_007877 [Rhizopus delemar]